MKTINKELLSLILGERIKDIYNLGSNPNLPPDVLPYSIAGDGDLHSITLKELTQKCMDWARENAYPFTMEKKNKKDKPFYAVWIKDATQNKDTAYLEIDKNEIESALTVCNLLLKNYIEKNLPF